MEGNVILAGPGSWGFDKWLPLIAPLAFYSVCVLALLGFGRSDDPNILRFFFRQISDSLRRLTGFPGWAMAGVLTGLLFLLIAVMGLYWDVAWHIDFGRDEQLFTPSHVMILTGLGGIMFAAALAVVFATIERAEAGFSLLGLRVPWSALTLGLMGAGAIGAFPLDNLWHEAYGLDITLWSPTHLQLLGGGSLATLAVWLMIGEALPHARPTATGRFVHVMAAGAALAGLSTFQGEFDYGVPQFQLLYLPILIAGAAGFGLVFARLAMGPGGALKAVAFYLALRLGLGLLVSTGFNHTYPRFPLYLASALLVEGVALLVGTERRLRFALAAGGLAGTVGLFGELAWVGAFYGGPSSPALLSKIALLGPLTALAAAVLAAGMARAFSKDDRPVPAAALGLAAVVLLGALAYPLPRDVGEVEAVIRLRQQGDTARVEVQLDPPDAAGGANAFAISSWQGGGRVTSGLREVGDGRYVSEKMLPVTGRWKTVVALNRGDEVMAAPVYMPADPEIGASAVPAVPERRVSFRRNTDVLLREAHPGPPLPATLAYIGWGGSVALWVAFLALTARTVGRTRAPSPDRAGTAPSPRPLLTAPEWSAGGRPSG